MFHKLFSYLFLANYINHKFSLSVYVYFMYTILQSKYYNHCSIYHCYKVNTSGPKKERLHSRNTLVSDHYCTCIRGFHWISRARSWLVVLKRPPMDVNCRRSEHCCSASHKRQCAGRYCIFVTAELEQVVAQHDMCLHQYADDDPVYISVAISDTDIAMDRFSACISDINSWMRASRLRLNPTKMQVIWCAAETGQYLSCSSFVHTSQASWVCSRAYLL